MLAFANDDNTSTSWYRWDGEQLQIDATVPIDAGPGIEPSPPGGVVNNAPGNQSEVCLDGWCAWARTPTSILVRADVDRNGASDEEAPDRTVWSRSREVPGQLIGGLSSCGNPTDTVQAFGWSSSDFESDSGSGSGDSQPTLFLALGRSGVATWTEAEGLRYHSLGSFENPARSSQVVGDLFLLNFFALPTFLCLSLLATAVSFAFFGPKSREDGGSPWKVAALMTANALLTASIVLLAVPGIASGPVGVTIIGATIVAAFITFIVVMATAEWQLSSWAVPLAIGTACYTTLTFVLAALAAYRRFGLGDGGSPAGNYLSWGLIAGVLATAAVATDRLRRTPTTDPGLTLRKCRTD